MLVEGLKTVTAAETNAEEIRAEANAKARKTVADARTSGEEQTARAVAEAEKMAVDISRKGEADAEKETAAAKRRAKAECDRLRAEADDSLQNVVNKIVERVVNG